VLDDQRRWPNGVPPDIQKRIAHELQLIEALSYAPYFLTVDEVVRFARSQGILCQGRGSAANSTVCYVLGITAVDPSKHDRWPIRHRRHDHQRHWPFQEPDRGRKVGAAWGRGYRIEGTDTHHGSFGPMAFAGCEPPHRQALRQPIEQLGQCLALTGFVFTRCRDGVLAAGEVGGMFPVRASNRAILSALWRGSVSARPAGHFRSTPGGIPRHGGEGQGRRAQPRTRRLGFAQGRGIRLPSRLLSPREPFLRLSARPDPTGSECGRVAIGRRRQVRSDGSFW
jgi:hypothetical protein